MNYISVIVPVFNSCDTIEKCLKAIRNQQGIAPATYEIIVVDDASTDSSSQMAESLCDRLITLQNNSGAASARNTGAKAAAGDIIVFVDSDVILEPYSLSSIISVFEKDVRISAAVGRYSETPADTKFLNVYHNAFTRYHHDLSLTEIDWFWGALSAVRKEAFAEAGGFDERYQGASGEDMALGMALFSKGHRIVYVPEAEGAHAHHFTIWKMLRNDYKKAVLGIKMRLSGNLPRHAPGFVNARSVMTSFLLALCPFLLLLNFAIDIPFLAKIYLLIFLALMIINRPYYVYLLKIFDIKFRFFVPLIHWLQMYTILAGAAMGALGHFLGRTAFGRPKWI